ncbi:MAG: SprT family zinc-dependent metalloprotease [Deltaproteobacteria bacterium]
MTEITIDKIIRSKRRSIALIVSSDAQLVVRAPMRTSLEYINGLVFRKRLWINRKKEQALKNGASAKPKQFTDGEEFYYLGKVYKLVFEDCHTISLADCFYFPEKHVSVCRERIIKWYKQMAKEKITERAQWYSRITGWKYNALSVTSAMTRWGSCGYNGSVNFSWRLIMAPIEVVDYVVVHELAHIAEKNHSDKFWNKVKVILPDYKERQRWLRENRVMLNI